MLQSMTGYGKAQVESPSAVVQVEIKTLNSKYNDIQIRLPRNASGLELKLRSLFLQKFVRGKVSVTIEVELTNYKLENWMNVQAFEDIYNQLNGLSNKLGASKNELFKLTWQALEQNKQDADLDEITEQVIVDAAKNAIQACLQFRVQEGEVIHKSILEYVTTIGHHVTLVQSQDKERITSLKQKLQTEIKRLNMEYDNNRFEQEIIYYIEKLDIQEELVRLQSHINYFKQTINEQNSNGKRLQFIAQEMGREINTIGSKANNAAIQKNVVQMKEELEKIKEQLLNVV